MDAFVLRQPTGSGLFWELMRRKDSRGIDVRENFGGGKNVMLDWATSDARSFFVVARRRTIIAGVTDDFSLVSLLFEAVGVWFVKQTRCVGRDFDGTVHRRGRRASSDLSPESKENALEEPRPRSEKSFCKC